MDQFEAIFNKIKEHCSKLDRNMLLDKLALDGRVVSALKRANVRTIGDLLESSR
jgi:DNA-directed RNA polymerase alpha subunit